MSAQDGHYGQCVFSLVCSCERSLFTPSVHVCCALTCCVFPEDRNTIWCSSCMLHSLDNGCVSFSTTFRSSCLEQWACPEERAGRRLRPRRRACADAERRINAGDADSLLKHSYSRSPKNPALQQFQKCSKSASAGSLRPIWNSLATVGVRDF